MIEQDVIKAARGIGYILEGTYPVEPYYLRGQCKMGFTLVDRADALAWVDEETKRQARTIRRAMQQNAEDDAREY